MTDLQPPGNGLPAAERVFLSVGLKTASAFLSDRRALRIFQRESTELHRIAFDDESYDVFQTYLIPRVIGIEDSSRNWSVAMVLDHLCLVNREIKIAVESLARGIVPRGEIDIAMYKPDPDVGDPVFDRFQQSVTEYVETLERLLTASPRLRGHPTFPHPWFGELGAHQWHVLACLHQRIHRRQAQKIVAMLGIT